MKKLADIRNEYSQQKLNEKEAKSSPYKMFEKWMNEAITAQVNEPTAMTISTVGSDQRPSSRTVLLKGLENEHFVFFTNYDSRKGRNIEHNPYVSILFFWPELERQVQIEGKVHKLDKLASDEYFKSRPRKSRIGARISPQSHVIPNRSYIKLAFAKEALKFVGKEVPRPENWGGYMVNADRIEFWQGRPSRLHDRILYERKGDEWEIVRLAP